MSCTVTQQTLRAMELNKHRVPDDSLSDVELLCEIVRRAAPMCGHE